MEEKLRVGVISSTHGIRGEAKVFPTTDNPGRFKKMKEVILDTGKEEEVLEIEGVKFFKNMVIVKFKGIDDINDMEKYKGKELYVTRENAQRLGKDEYFIADLLGMDVVEDTGRKLGKIKDIIETGANDNYENSSVVKIDGETMRGYKLGVLRGILDDSGIAEEIVFGTLKTHDMEQCREMLKNTSCFHENDILINDRGFLSREITNYLKTERRVDTYIPARENMTVYQDAVKLATASGKWHKHPNPKRKDQEIQLVTDLGPLWESGEPEKDVPINACVVHDKKTDKYFVFMTTDTGRTARQIINTYELRPEIEEDFRQMKDFWKLEDFKSTKYNYITYHIVMTLVGYLYFQIYKNLDEGKKYAGKSLPVVVKNYKETRPKSVIIYVGQYFGIFPFLEFLQLYAECTLEVRRLLDPILAKV